MNKVQELTTAIFYTSATCNLNCRYCNINKNNLLPKIDEVLAESFKGDYYLQRVKKYFYRPDMLKKFETWGGEPFLHMDRLYPVLHQLIKEFPFLKEGYSSTNFSFDGWLDQFLGLMDVFAYYPNRYFEYCLQLSVDGPPEINDAGRGDGTTKKCLNNFNQLIEYYSKHSLPENIKLFIVLKGTLDNGTCYDLCDKEKIIQYYKWIENTYMDPVKNLHQNNIDIGCSIPNTAVPSPVTVQDGKNFANFVKYCREIEQENFEKHYFKYYTQITPYCSNVNQDILTYNYNCHTCGTGTVDVGFLPNNMMSTCHEGFVQIAEEYYELAQKNPNLKSTIQLDAFLNESKNYMCVDDEHFVNHIYKMKLYDEPNTTARLVNNAALIMALAMAGQVDQKYILETNALKAAIFIQSHCPYCIKDNYNTTGSYTLMPVGIFKLLLNGAMEYIQEDQELHAYNLEVADG